MDAIKKRTPDYTDIAYREAVSRLRYLLAESYSPYASRSNLHQVHISKIEESGDETEGSVVLSERSRPPPVIYRTAPAYSSKRTPYNDSLQRLTQAPQMGSTLHVPGPAPLGAVAKGGEQPPPELMAFIERQEEYIEQLEKESQYCRDELSNLLGKVKDVINENEGLHEKEKSGLLKSVFTCFESEDEENHDMEEEKAPERKPMQAKKKRLEGPSIVFESRISELEAQLTQTKIDLRKALEEAELYKKKLNEGYSQAPSDGFASMSNNSDHNLRQQVEALQREKNEMNANLAKLQTALAQFRDKEADASNKAKRSLDVVDQAQFEKAQSDGEVRRLKDELDRQHEKMRELLQEQGRKLQDERGAAERRYAHQVEQLSADLALQWDLTSKLQMELEKQRRAEADLRREVQQKTITVDDLKKELQIKIAGLQGELMQAAGEKGSVEQELSASRLQAERTERESRQEVARLQAEVAALRQRLDRADADVLHSRRETLRLTDQVGALEREVNLAKMMNESKEKLSPAGFTPNSPSKSAQRDQEISSMIHDMEAKHVQTVAELEGMILSQNAVMDKLKDECHALTERLEDSSARHKSEKIGYRSENGMLMEKLAKVWENCKELHKECGVDCRMSADSNYQETAVHIELSPIQSPSTPFSPSKSPSYSSMPSESPNYSLMPSKSQNYSHMPNESPNYSHIPNESPNYSHTPNESPNYSHMPSKSPNYSHMPSKSPNYSHMPSKSPNYSSTLTVKPSTPSRDQIHSSTSNNSSPNQIPLATYPSPPHLSSTRREERPSHRPLTLQDLATDSDSSE